MRRPIVVPAILIGFAVAAFMMAPGAGAQDVSLPSATEWQSPPADWLEVLHAPQLRMVWTAPTGEHMLLADPVLYPPLAELAGPMHKLAGMRVNPATNGYHGQHGGTSPRLVRVEGGATTPLDLPADAEVLDVEWSVDGRRFALTVGFADRIGLWVGSVDGEVTGFERPGSQPADGQSGDLAT